MQSLQEICYKNIGEHIVNLPEHIQELIFKNSKKSYEKKLREELKKEIREELRVEIIEELFEEYFNQIQPLVEEASELILHQEDKSENNIKRILKTNFLINDTEIVDLAVECSVTSYNICKNANYNTQCICNNYDTYYDTYDDVY